VNQCTRSLRLPEILTQTEVDAWVKRLSSSGLRPKSVDWHAEELKGSRHLSLIAAAPELSSAWHAVEALTVAGVADAAFLQASDLPCMHWIMNMYLLPTQLLPALLCPSM
jgi:hypothetical protein